MTKASSTGPLAGFQRALVLAAHTDDEFGCAGTMRRLVEQGTEVRYLALSRCEASVPEGLPKDVLVGECRACMACIGLPDQAVIVGRYEVRYFPRDRQAILEEFVRIARDYRPDLVLLPSSADTHQDHNTVYEEGFRAFKHATLLGYELPQNLISFRNSAFVPLSEHDLALKVEALERYASQRFRSYSTADFIRGLARVRGVQCGAEYAEAFEAVRLVMR